MALQDVVLRNLSENGTIVNTHILKAGQEQTLQSGDVITIVGRSLRYEENTSGEAAATTPQGPPRVADGPRTVGGPSNGGGRRAPLVVFASGGGPDNSQHRQLRRKLSRTPRNPETARKLKLWDAHYSGSAPTATTSDILVESPPPGLLSDCQPEDPFALGDANGRQGSFERMAQSVAGRDPAVAAEVARIMDDISQMAAQSRSPLRMATPLQPSRKRPRPSSSTEDMANGSERRRSRSLERPLQRAAGEAKVAAYGSEDETSRGTVGVSPQSTYSRSPTLHRLRHDGPQSQPQSAAAQKSAPIQRANSQASAKTPEAQRRQLTPSQYFSSLPRPVSHCPQGTSRRAASNGSPSAARLLSPLKRTLSSSSSAPAIRPPPPPSRPAPPTAADDGDDSEEVPTEPEPESELEPEPEPKLVAAAATPENRSVGQRPLLAAQESIARKSVRFGPALSPEVFDVAAPPSTPLRRGTPMQMPVRAPSSILRRSSPTRSQPVASPTLLIRSLLTPRPTRRQAMNQYFASLSVVAESPAMAVDQPLAEKEEEAAVPAAAAEPAEEEGEAAAAAEPAVDIASPTVLGASSADRRQRRRRSVGAPASNSRRVTLDSPLRVPPPPPPPAKDSPTGSPAVLLVKKAAPNRDYLESPTTRRPPSLSAQRRERRRTAPALGSADLSASMAQMAAALGEDVPTLFAQKKKPKEPVDPIVVAEVVPDTASDVAPLGLADAMQQELQQQREEDVAAIREEMEEETATSSNIVLLEQAERQARIQGSTPDESFNDSLAEASKLAGLSVTSPPPTPTITFSSMSSSRKQRRQTMADFAPLSTEMSTEMEQLASVDEILAHRQRLKRIQDRKRRRQTVADLNKRRSSWRGWMPASGTPLVDSPPSSPVASHVVADWSTPFAKSDEAKAGEEELLSPPNNIMYPPIAWNSSESPTKRRRMRDILGFAKAVPHSVELANDPKHGTRQCAAESGFAYPPKPVPIDAEWVEVERPGDAHNGESPRLASESAGVSQQVELFAVSAPASDIDTASLFSAHVPAEKEEQVAIVEDEQPAVAEDEQPAVAEDEQPAVAEAKEPVAAEKPPVARAVFSPPTTRGKASRQCPPPKPEPVPANRPTIKRSTAPRPPPTTTRKRSAEDPAPLPPVKRGRGRPPNTSTARRAPEACITSPPATRSSKRKPH
ncbi:hypothetical protein IW152_004755 [Coemansia sp. BCRC 34962]|nr:hypothetical protein IW152_004755 [Coemansia sp. BCRC 34962]